MRVLLWWVMILPITACGYQVLTPGGITNLGVSIEDPVLARDLNDIVQRELLGSGPQTSDAADQWQLRLLEERYQKTPIAVAAFENHAEFELVLTWVIALDNPAGESVVDEESFTVREHFTRDNRRLVASFEAERAMKIPLRSELARRVGYWLRSITSQEDR